MYVKERHDCGLLRQNGSTKVGFLLAKDKSGLKIWEEFDDEYLAIHQTDEAGYGALQPEKEFRIGQESYRSGFGLKDYNSSDPERYHLAYNLDMRNRDIVLPSYGATSVTKPSAPTPTLANVDMELDASWGGGAQSATQNHTGGGTYSWFKTASGSITQTIANIKPGLTYTIKVWVYPTSVGGCKVGINDGVTLTYGDTSTGTGAWEQITHTKTIAATASGGTAFLTTVDEDDNYFDDVTIEVTALTAGTTVAFAEFNDKLYASFGRTLGVLNGAGTAFTFVAYFPATITDLEPFTDSKLYIAQGTGAAYYEMNTSEALTINTLTVKTFQFFETVHGSSPTMWGNDGTNTLRSTVNPANGGTQWSAQTTVSSSYKAITDLKAYTNLLYIMKEDRPYYLDSSGNVKILTNITTAITHSEGGKNVTEWNGNIYMPWSTEALLEYNDTAATFTWLW